MALALELDVEPVLSGGTLELTASDAPPGETVHFVVGLNGTAGGPCPAFLGGACLDVESPIILGSAAANLAGVATLSGVVPESLSAWELDFQAAHGGSTPAVSTAVHTTLLLSAAQAVGQWSGEGADDWAGRSLASAGDMDANGTPDLLIGALWHDGAGVNAGVVYLVHDPTPGPLRSLSAADARFDAEGGHDAAGQAIAGGGDLNGDGFDDLVIAADAEDSAGFNAGAIYFLYGPVTDDVALADADVKALGEAEFDLAGVSVDLVPDVNGDGTSEAFIGARYHDESFDDAGSAYLVHGTGHTGDWSLSWAHAELLGEAAGDWAGIRVASGGDPDGDGTPDLLVGARYEDTAGVDAGAAYLVSGTTTGTVSLADARAKLLGEEAGDRVSAVATAGDVDGDGLDDLLIGQFHEPGDLAAGAAYLVRGPVSGDLDLATADARIDGVPGDNLGYWVDTAGDVNADGFADILVSAPYDATGGVEAGAARLFLGPISGTVPAASAHATWIGNAGDWTGLIVPIGDVDGDGLDDLAIGMAHAGAADQGAVGLILGADL